MVKKTTAQLKREIEKLKKEDLEKRKKIHKAMQEKKEREELEKELKDLKRSPIFKKLKRLSRKAPSKEQLRMHGKQSDSAAKTFWKAAGKVVNKLDKIKI